MKKQLCLLLGIILLLGIASAGHASWDNDVWYKEKLEKTAYDYDGDITYKHTTYAYYDNDERHPTHFYKDGWTWRTTEAYWDEAHNKQYYATYNNEPYHYKKHSYTKTHHHSHKHDYHSAHYYGKPIKSSYYTYVDYLNTIEKKECYHHPPKGTLFYIKCP